MAKIQVSESISNLFFILDDNFLIASSIEGYLYIYKLNTELIKKLQRDNELKNSTEEKNIIKNKLLLLKKLMESDTSLSKNDQVKNLLNKFQQSEETTIEDLKILDGFVKDGKKNLNKKPKEIELKEEKNDFDEQENQNNQNNQNELNKSNIFEKGLRERISFNDSYMQKKNFGRKSLIDNYNSKQMNFNKNRENNNNIDNKENAMENEFQKKFSNININEEFSRNNKNKYNNENIGSINRDEIKEEIEETPSIYQPKIIDNTQTQLSETHINNLKIIQTSNYDVKSFNIHTIKKGFDICKENEIFFKPKKNENILIIKNINNIELINDEDQKEKLIKCIDDNFINKIEDQNDLKEIEDCVEKLLSEIRLKIGKEEKDILMEKMVDKYSKLIIDKININKNKENDD